MSQAIAMRHMSGVVNASTEKNLNLLSREYDDEGWTDAMLADIEAELAEALP